MGNLESMERYAKVREKSGMPKDMRLERKFSQKFSLYFRKRGLSPHTLTREMVYEDSRGIVGFPFYERENVVNVKFFNQDYPEKGKLKWWQLRKEYGTKTCFWGLQNLVINKDPLRQEANVVTITEGEWDKLTYNEVGIDNILSVPQGAPAVGSKNFTEEFKYARDPYFQKEVAKYVDVWILSVDDDEAGQLLLEYLSQILGRYKCKKILYPKGYKDINEVHAGSKEKKLAAMGPEAVKECHLNAQGLPVAGIIRPSMLKYDLDRFAKEGLQPGLKTGIPELDFIFTVKPKHNSFITGVPGMGKSVWLRWYLMTLARNNPELTFGMFDPENARPTARSYVKLAELMFHKRFQEGFEDSMTPGERSESLNYLEKHFTIVGPDKSNFEDFDGSIKMTNLNRLESICKYFAHLKKTQNIFGYVIDAYNKLDNDPPGHLTDTKFIEKQLDYLVDFNEYNDLHGWVIAHPLKLQKDKNGNYAMPSLYDIKGSSAWHEKVDIGLAIHRYKFKAIRDSELTPEERQLKEDSPAEFEEMKIKAKESSITYMKCEKIRFEELGTEGILKFDYLPYNDFRINYLDKGYHERTKKLNKSDEEAQDVDPWLPFEDDNGELPF